MGSPVSSVVANLVMENIETRALETFADPPRIWKRYVDDTFVIMKRSKLSEFLTQLNTIESSIQFTMKKEKEGCLPFLDILIKRSPSGHLLSALQWRLVVKLAGRAAKFHLWLNIWDCHPGCFHNIVAFPVTPAVLILSNS